VLYNLTGHPRGRNHFLLILFFRRLHDMSFRNKILVFSKNIKLLRIYVLTFFFESLVVLRDNIVYFDSSEGGIKFN
jgi:hypothetical protein